MHSFRMRWLRRVLPAASSRSRRETRSGAALPGGILLALLLLPACGATEEYDGDAAPRAPAPDEPRDPSPPMPIPPASANGGGHTGKPASKNGGGSGPPEAPYFCEVFYSTNRGRMTTDDGSVKYGSERSRSLEYGVCSVTIPPGHVTGRLERPNWLRLEFKEDPRKHVTLALVSPFGSEDLFLGALRRTLERSPEKEVFVFVHGFANDFEDAARRTAQLAYDLGLCEESSYVVPMMFSWPSLGLVQGYGADSESADYSMPFLKETLLTLHRKAGVRRINILAHSMGNQVLAMAVRDIARDLTADEPVILQEMVLAAPDIDRDIFETQVVPEMGRVARRVTLYASDRDKALSASMKLQVFPRLGTVMVAAGGERRIFVNPRLDSVDASRTDTSLLGHGYYAEVKEVIEDISRLVREKRSPPDRGLVESGRGWWDFK